MTVLDIRRQILDLARWAPSGDNTQPWRFELVGNDRVAIHGFDTREWCLYDFRARASHMAHGALLETIRIAASAHSRRVTWSLRPDGDDRAPVYDVLFDESSDIVPDDLLPFVTSRVVQRRAMKTTPLTGDQLRALVAAVGPDFRLQILSSPRQRTDVAWLLWKSAYLRLVCPEAYEVHREVIEWGARYSKDRIPEAAVGADPLLAVIMRWAMRRKERVDFMNRYLFGTMMPRLELDVIPAIACAAHVLMHSNRPLNGLLDHVEAGAAMQRLWLTAASVGLYLQPQMTPVIFRWYALEGEPISASAKVNALAKGVVDTFHRVVGCSHDDSFAFFARVGSGAEPSSRSLRLDLGDLWWKPSGVGER